VHVTESHFLYRSFAYNICASGITKYSYINAAVHVFTKILVIDQGIKRSIRQRDTSSDRTLTDTIKTVSPLNSLNKDLSILHLYLHSKYDNKASDIITHLCDNQLLEDGHRLLQEDGWSTGNNTLVTHFPNIFDFLCTIEHYNVLHANDSVCTYTI
jgi:hypothetical protein